MYTSITVKADNAKNIVKQLEKAFEGSLESENNEHCLEIPEKRGSGYLKATIFENGLSVIEADFLLNKSLKIELKKESTNPLSILFNSESSITHIESSSNTKTDINKFESIMFSNDMKDFNTLVIDKEKATCFIMLVINRRKFEPKVCDFLDSMPPEIETIFQDLNGVNLFCYKGFYSLETAEAIDSIKNTDKEGLLKSIFIESKAFEMLAYQLQQFSDDQNDPEKREILRKSTLDKVEKAAELVKNDLATTMSVNQLAKKVGLNQNTLQSGFQRLFKSSVNDYIKSKRIVKAKELIETSDMNITEITYAVGINSRSYFSKLFKEKYKMTPNKYLKQSRENRSA
ncbi:AraC family transcriptional regulator [Winogradskyella maritima]|uniref:Helix-turn-helix domain-containing protein n=1 Tax=Winogradskyella maritima TaxID=1517766 RepID=A0ABV8AJE1_9FLAO|nr:AraC family transcriptional regulator [Winogradskyella maritima]